MEPLSCRVFRTRTRTPCCSGAAWLWLSALQKQSKCRAAFGCGVIFTTYSDCFPALPPCCPTLLFIRAVCFQRDAFLLSRLEFGVFPAAGSPIRNKSALHTLKSHLQQRRGGVLPPPSPPSSRSLAAKTNCEMSV